jgi:serine/threonine kinase 38
VYLHFHHLIVTAGAPLPQDGEVIYKDWVFINYTFKRFEGLTQRGTPTKK